MNDAEDLASKPGCNTETPLPIAPADATTNGANGIRPESAPQDESTGDESPPEEIVDAEFVDAAPSTKVAHDFVPALAEENFSPSVSEQGKSDTIFCPDCNTELKIWQLSCHGCGKAMSDQSAPDAHDFTISAEELQQVFSDWYQQGVAAFEAGQFSEAQNCFNEALLRVKGLEAATDREAELRKYLARALLRLDKKSEAAEQYVLLSKLLGAAGSQDYERARELAMSTVNAMARVASAPIFRLPTRREAKLVPLYCSNCKQLLVEAEVYGFRNGKSPTVRCFCGYEGMPMVRYDANHLRALKEEPTLRMMRAQLLDAASETVDGGRNKSTAIALAIVFGWCGGHRFYLGQAYYGAAYAIWFVAVWLMIFINGKTFDTGGFILSLAPWIVAIAEAFQLSKMSRVSFNLTYNVERVIDKLPPEEPRIETSNDVFSMDPGEQPIEPDEGFEDEMSSIKLRTIAPNTVLSKPCEVESEPG